MSKPAAVKTNLRTAKTIETLNDAWPVSKGVSTSKFKKGDHPIATASLTQDTSEAIFRQILNQDEKQRTVEKTFKESVTPKIASKPQIGEVDVSVKNIGAGLVKIYTDKTEMVLSHFSFLAKNKAVLLKSFLYLGVPALVTWFMITRVAAISELLRSEKQVLSVFYVCVFYLAISLLSLTAQLMIVGIWKIIRQGAENIARSGATSN